MESDGCRGLERGLLSTAAVCGVGGPGTLASRAGDCRVTGREMGKVLSGMVVVKAAGF